MVGRSELTKGLAAARLKRYGCLEQCLSVKLKDISLLGNEAARVHHGRDVPLDSVWPRFSELVNLHHSTQIKEIKTYGMR